ncbi:MAG TPA: deoxyhypusine synthase, partial [Thermoanaerobaculia bacterium]
MGTRTPRPKTPKAATKGAASRAPKKAEKQPEKNSGFLKGNRIYPQPIAKGAVVADLIDNAFTAYNAGRLREACRLYTEKMLADDCTVGVSLSGALTPTGLGKSVLIPLIEHGFLDWIISTGANVYHDAHFGIGLKLHYGSPFLDDTRLRAEGVVRIYDILFDYHVLLDTDRFFRTILSQPEFRGPMSTAEFHHRIGRYVHETEKQLGIGTVSLLSAAYQYDVPIYTSSPGDSSIGMNVAGLALAGSTFSFDVSADVNETASIVLEAKKGGGKSGVMLIGGGSPKNFMLQTEPQIQEVLMIDEEGH